MNLPRTYAALAAAITTAGLLSACAVGPNFKAPAAPHSAGYAPSGQIAAQTPALPMPGGKSQRFVDDMDIPGQWWTLPRT